MENFFHHFTARYTITWLGFWGTLTVYFCRLNLSISIVSMVKYLNNTSYDNNITICPSRAIYKNHSELNFNENESGEFDWGLGAQGKRFFIFSCKSHLHYRNDSFIIHYSS